MSTLFNAQSLEALVRTFDGLTVEALGKWKQGETMLVLREALKVLLTVHRHSLNPIILLEIVVVADNVRGHMQASDEHRERRRTG